MELSCRGYMREQPAPVMEDKWPTPYDESYAEPIRKVLRSVIESCLEFAKSQRRVGA